MRKVGSTMISIIASLILLTSNVFGTSMPLCISLGYACGPAIHLRNLGMRFEAYPFDWIVCPHQELCAVLEDDFKHFLTDLRLLPNGQGVSDHYGIWFTHDWPTVHQPNIDALNADYVNHCTLSREWEKALPLVREKYKRRIKRFNDACNGSQRIFFIVNDNKSPEQAVVLRDLLRKKYRTLDFLLLVFSAESSSITPWNIEGIKNFYVPRWDDTLLWKNTLQQVGPEFNFLRLQKRYLPFSYSLDCSECIGE